MKMVTWFSRALFACWLSFAVGLAPSSANFLPGMSGVAGTLNEQLTFSYFDSVGGTADVVVPSGVAADDILIFYQNSYQNAGTPTDVTASGFTDVSNLTLGGTTNARFKVSYKRAVGTEGGTTLSPVVGAQGNRRRLLVLRPNRPYSSLTVGGLNEVLTASDPSSQTILSGAQAAPVIAIGCAGRDGSGANPPSASMSPSEDGIANAASNTQAAIYYKIFNSSPANVTFDMGDDGAYNGLASFYMVAN
jgi:hypothetical protein